MTHLPTLQDIVNSTREHIVEMTFHNCLDAQTLTNIFLAATLSSQTTTSPHPDIIKLDIKDTLCRVIFSNSGAQSNMMGNLERLINERIPQHVQDELNISYTKSTNTYPKRAVA